MVFEASDYAIWMVFTFLEALAIRFSRNKPELQPIRAFMTLCLMRDFILLIGSCHLKYYWVSIWLGNQAEWIALELVIILMIGKHFAWKVFPAMILGICLYYDLAKGWPVKALPEEIFHLERNMCIIILGTLLIAAVFIFEKKQIPIAAAMGILALSDMLSAQSFLAGNYSPRMASLLWVAGLCTLLAAVRGHFDSSRIASSPIQAATVYGVDTNSPQPPEQSSEAKLLDEASRLREWLSLPCPSQLQ